jgi:excisionase family DNA binding protein
MSERYMTKLEAAKYLTVTPRTIDNLRKRGELACSKIGGRVVFDRQDLDKLVELNRAGTTATKG